MPATIEITEFDRGNVFLSFGDIETVDPPNIIKGGKGLYQTSGDGTNAQDVTVMDVANSSGKRQISNGD